MFWLERRYPDEFALKTVSRDSGQPAANGLMCGKSDPLGQDRLQEIDKGKALAAHSTLNRLELSAQGIDWRYRKIQAQPEQLEALLIQRGVKAIPRKSAFDRAGF
jgi:hypothetical protein